MGGPGKRTKALFVRCEWPHLFRRAVEHHRIAGIPTHRWYHSARIDEAMPAFHDQAQENLREAVSQYFCQQGYGGTACFAPHVVAWPVATLLRVVQAELRFDPAALEALAREIVARETKPVAKAAKITKWLDVPSGTTWEQVLITFHNTDALTIQAPGTSQGEAFTYEELGFWDDRTSDPAAERYLPDALWRRFLRFAALYLPDEAVTRAAWAGPEVKQQAHVGFLLGVVFGFLLQKGGVGDYDVILGQLLFRDFSVLKIMLSAVVTGMLGIHLMRSLGWVTLHPKPGSVGATVIGGLIFGAGFAILGYCPGIIGVAAAQGAMDALIGGAVGILLGAWLFAVWYPRLQPRVLAFKDFGDMTVPQFARLNAWAIVIPVAAAITAFLWWLERIGL